MEPLVHPRCTLIAMPVSARIIALASVVAALAACTSSPSAPVQSVSGQAGSPEASQVATGLRPVRNYAQEFCKGAATSTQCPKGAVPDALRRPLDIPHIDAGDPCPVSKPNPDIWSRLAPGLGPGPVAPVGLGSHSILRYVPFPGSDWGGQKVLWVAEHNYDSPILIRGGRVDGVGSVGFDMGSSRPLTELQLPPGPTLNIDRGYREWPSHTRVTDPGCYAHQVDGTELSYAIVFEAVQGH